MKSCIDHNSTILKILIEETMKVKKLQHAEITFVIKRTFYLQKVEAPIVALGILI